MSTTRLRIAIFGAGALGLYLAGRLAQSGQSITLVTRPGPRFIFPLTIDEGGRRDQYNDIQASTSWNAQPQDVVIVTVKAHQLPAALPELARWQGPNTQLILLQGGLPWWYRPTPTGQGTPRPLQACDPDGLLAAGIDLHRAIAGVVHKTLERRERNGVAALRTPRDRITLGRPLGGKDDILLFLTGLLRRAGLPAEASGDLRPALWERLLDSVVFDPLCAVTASNLATTLAMPGTRPTVLKALREAHAVALANGIAPTADPAARLERARMAAARGAWHGPMLQDRLAGRALELAPSLGALLELAARSRIATPHLATLHACAAALSPHPMAPQEDHTIPASDHYLLRKRA